MKKNASQSVYKIDKPLWLEVRDQNIWLSVTKRQPIFRIAYAWAKVCFMWQFVIVAAVASFVVFGFVMNVYCLMWAHCKHMAYKSNDDDATQTNGKNSRICKQLSNVLALSKMHIRCHSKWLSHTVGHPITNSIAENSFAHLSCQNRKNQEKKQISTKYINIGNKVRCIEDKRIHFFPIQMMFGVSTCIDAIQPCFALIP